MASDAPPTTGRHRATGGHGRAPAAARPGSTGARLDGLDVARGLAVLSMLVAHLSPVGGVLEVSEYLTAPLFAVVIGVAISLRLGRPGVDRRRVVADDVLRGVLLVLVGVILQALYDQIDVVLPYLGVLVVVLAPLALLLRPLPVLTVGLVAAGAVVGPIVTDRARDHLAVGGGDVLWSWLATGADYRLVSFLPMALTGLVLAYLLPTLQRIVTTAAIGAVLLVAALAVHLLGRASDAGAAAYSGTTAEVVAACFLASGVVVGSFALVLVVHDHVPALTPVLTPLRATGRLALTAYTLQIVVLAVVAAARGGARDDTWPILLGTTVVVVGVCWLLDRTVGTGPLEVVVRAVRVPTRGRHGAVVDPRGPTTRSRRPADG